MPDQAEPSHLSAAACAPPASLYLHIPFCPAKCSYCDFSSYPRLGALYAPYVEALLREVEQTGAQWGRPPLQTVYIGGGTPTVLPAALLLRLLEATARAFELAPGAEITIEANPGTVTLELLDALRRAGVNRLSYGVQSLQPAFLRLLGRSHSAAQAAQAVRLARAAGLPAISLDLIYGLPGQAPAAWQADLEAALALEPDHLSLYALTLEPGTPLAEGVSCGAVPEPDAELAAEMYEHAEARLPQAGYDHYELSNWARTPAQRSRHNLTYWRNLPYAGCGAAAYSFLAGRRRGNVAHPRDYVARIQRGESTTAEEERISPKLELAETMILGLRLVAGVSRARFRARFGADPIAVYPEAIGESTALGLLETGDEAIRLTPRGRLLGNQVFV
ncbi:MAG TPA: radical SAM family heme chaperone HemW, partial [Anaerolineae bacterium]|nr:radical SAM family heme chaperone HemW [Anaerolineae bacterium]